MNKGRAKCERLKKIRKAMADRLHVDLHQKECTFEGNCRGTCPKCKQEEEILNRELLKRAVGLGIGALAGLSLAGCAPFQTEGEVPVYREPEEGEAPIYEEFEGGILEPVEEYPEPEEVLPVEEDVEGLMPYEEEAPDEGGDVSLSVKENSNIETEKNTWK